MAKNNGSILSDYFLSLDTKSKKRYVQKLYLINGKDIHPQERRFFSGQERFLEFSVSYSCSRLHRKLQVFKLNFDGLFL